MTLSADPAREATPVCDLGPLGFDRGGHLPVKLALATVPVGAPVVVRGSAPDLARHLRVWARQLGHGFDGETGELLVRRGAPSASRHVGAERAGRPDPAGDTLAWRVPPSWGLAARGATVEAGGPSPRFALDGRDELWTDTAPRLYAQAAGAQWDPAAAVDWGAPIEHPAVVEDAVVQLMTFLVENEEAALVVPARFLGQVHPHFREIQQVLAVTVADEARHIEVFTRRARLTGRSLGFSSASGRRSLQTLLDEPDFAISAFLLSVLGEGTFVSLLGFLERHAPDPVTRSITALARNDEARHVAFALGHLERHASTEPTLRARLAHAVERRHQALGDTAGLNAEVFDALVLLAAGSPDPAAIARGWDAVQDLQADMDEGRRHRLARLGFTTGEAEAISSLHTRNFM